MVWYMNYEESKERSGSGRIRLWSEAARYGFISAGGGGRYTRLLPAIQPGDEVWAFIPKRGYVGYGVVRQEARPASSVEVIVDSASVPFFSLGLEGSYFRDAFEEEQELVLLVDWVKTVPASAAVWEAGFFYYQGINCRPKKRWPETRARLLELWGLSSPVENSVEIV